MKKLKKILNSEKINFIALTISLLSLLTITAIDKMTIASVLAVITAVIEVNLIRITIK